MQDWKIFPSVEVMESKPGAYRGDLLHEKYLNYRKQATPVEVVSQCKFFMITKVSYLRAKSSVLNNALVLPPLNILQINIWEEKDFGDISDRDFLL